MRLFELESNVASFPKKGIDVTKTGVEVPAGYDSFYVKDTASGKSASIFGIRPDGKHVQISTTTKELADILAKAYNSGGRSNVSIEKVSMVDAFGSDIEKAFDASGVKFAEKPESWNYIKNQYSCSLAQLKEATGMIGHLAEVTAKDVFADGYGKSPMSDLVAQHPDSCIINFPNGDKFVADKGGSRSYYRMWLYVRPSGLTVVK